MHGTDGRVGSTFANGRMSGYFHTVKKMLIPFDPAWTPAFLRRNEVMLRTARADEGSR